MVCRNPLIFCSRSSGVSAISSMIACWGWGPDLRTSIWSPLSVMCTGDRCSALYIRALFALSDAVRCRLVCTFALCFFSFIKSVRRDALFGVLIASRVSSAGVVCRVQRVSALLSCPSMRVSVFFQSPWTSLHPLLPGPSWALLTYIHRFFSCVVGDCCLLGGTMFHPCCGVVVKVVCICFIGGCMVGCALGFAIWDGMWLLVLGCVVGLFVVLVGSMM